MITKAADKAAFFHVVLSYKRFGIHFYKKGVVTPFVRRRQREFICISEAPEMNDRPEFAIAISKAFLASLKKRGFLTEKQVADCVFKLEHAYYR